MQQKDQNISQEVQQNDQNVIPESETKRSKLARITCVSVSSKGREEIFLTQFASGLRRLSFCVLQSCQFLFSLSIRRFWGKRGKMEAKKGES